MRYSLRPYTLLTMRRRIVLVEIILGTLLLNVPVVSAVTYSAGIYGACQFSSCNITLTTEPSLNMPVTPSANSVRCTINEHTVSVSTGSTTGYTLLVSDSDASAALQGVYNSIQPLSGTSSSPAILTANTWGYRVDNSNGFGAGPTATGQNITIPDITFAGMPLTTAPDILKSTTSAASTADVTSVYYGLCLDYSVQSGEYSDGIEYSALIN